jgi:CRISPR-associated protein Cas1
LDVPHFYFTGDDYQYRFDAEARSRFIDLLREQFNSGANYQGLVMKWDTVIEQTATELARFLKGRSRVLDFAEPCLVLERSDDVTLRRRIQSLSHVDAVRLAIGKSTLHYLRRNAKRETGFTVYAKTRQRLKIP